MKTIFSIIFFFFSFAVVFSQADENEKPDFINESDFGHHEQYINKNIIERGFKFKNKFMNPKPELLNNKKPKTQDRTFIVDYVILYTEDGQRRASYTFNDKGKMLTKLSERWENNDWVNDYHYTYTYDTDGNLLTELREEWDNGNWVNDYRYIFTFDTDGNRLTQLSERWENNDWVNYWSLTYTYDIDGNLLTQLRENWKNND